LNKLIKIAIRNQSLTFFTVIIIVIFGILSYLNLPQNEDPPVSIRIVQIITYWEGAAPEDVELYISKPIETAASKQDDVSKITSHSLPGVSVISVEISDYLKASRVNNAFQQIRNYVNDSRGNLPENITGPFINDRFGETTAFVLGVVSESGNHSYRELESIGERIKDRIKTVKGVGDFELIGVQPEKIYVQGSYTYITNLGILPGQIYQAIKNRNSQMPRAYLNLADKRIQVEVTGPYKNLKEIAETIVYTDNEGHVLRIKDLEGEVFAGYKDPPDQLTRANGKKSIIIAFSMKRGYNIVKWGKKIDRVLKSVREDLPADIKLATLFHQPEGVDKSVKNFMSNFYQAIVIVLVIIGIGMGFKNAMVVAVAVPLIMIATFAVMGIMKIELHQMSINALIISLGMVVDNAIVIVDNVNRYIRLGYTKAKAAFLGASEVKIALFSGTLTTVCAFAPLAMMPGDVGAYIVDLPRVISIALILSYLVAMFVTPVTAKVFLPSKEERDKKKKKKKENDNLPDRKDESSKKPASAFTRFYYGLVDAILRFRYIVVILILLLFAGSVYTAINFIPITFFPGFQECL